MPRIGSRPPWARASTRRSSARRTRWSVSSDALRSAARNSSGLRSRASARSSSAFRTASGVRSSWLASSMKRRSASTDAWIRSRRSFIVAPSRVISSSAGGRDRRPRDRSTRSPPPRSACARPAPERRPPATIRRATAGATAIGAPIPSVTASCSSWSARSCSEVPTITTALPGGRLHRRGEQPADVVDPGKVAIEERRRRDRPDHGRREHRGPSHDVVRTDDLAGGVGDLCERLVGLDEPGTDVNGRRPAPPSVDDQDRRARSEAGLDRVQQIGGGPEVDEHPERRQRDRRPHGEDEREPLPKRERRPASHHGGGSRHA